MSDFPISNNIEQSRFEAVVDGETAVLDYELDPSAGSGQAPDVIAFVHTGVPAAIDNRGIGTALVRTGLDYAEEHGLRVRPICVFVESFIEEHEAYQHLVD